MNDLTRVSLYARVSSEQQADEMTIQSQLDLIQQRIAADGVQIEPELSFVDDGFSGFSMQRPALERLRDLTYSGVIDRLYVYDPDRLARKYAYQVVLIEEFHKHGVEVVFLNAVAGAASAEANLLLQMQGMIAEYERAKILERTRRGRRYAARQGKVSALGNAPYGYRYVSKRETGGEARYEVASETCQFVQAIFTWVGVEGLSLGEVKRRLAEQGVPSPTGQIGWDRATIRGILLNPAYYGTAKYGKTRLLPKKNERRPMRNATVGRRSDQTAVATPAAEQEAIPVPALVSLELFEAVSQRLEENRRRYRAQKKGTEFLLGGLLVCGQCGSACCGRRHRAKDGKEYVYYRCIGADRHRRQGGWICENAGMPGRVEAAVWSDLCSVLQDPDRVRREFEQRLQRPVSDDVEATRLKQGIAQQKRRIARLIDAYENGWLDKEEFEPRVRSAKERLARDEAMLQDQQQADDQAEDMRLVIGRFDAFAAEIRVGLDEADFEMKRRLLRLLVNRIEVTDEEVRVVYRVSLRPFVNSPFDSKGAFLQHCLKSERALQARKSSITPWWRGARKLDDLLTWEARYGLAFGAATGS
jgi:site-specific DNA recombinase